MPSDADLVLRLRRLLGDGPMRPIPAQNDDDRRTLARETGGTPVLDIAAYSNVASTPFIDYLNGDILHTLQQPRSDEPDEMTFITMAHVMELNFKLMSYELLRAQAALRRDDLDEACLIFARGVRVLELLAQVWSVVSTITPRGYLGFRDHLGVGSGFESFMYRHLEFLLGNKQPRMLAPHRHVPDVHRMLEETLRAPSVYDDAIALLHRRGYAIDEAALDRDWAEPYESNASVRAAWQRVYREQLPDHELYRFAEALVDLADRFKVWRYRHYVSVERLIGSKPGTGGTSGIGWLKQILDHNFFPELWEARSAL
jgi:tryptophan 2,3-dioxygenase